MSMTLEEYKAKIAIANILRKQGYSRYARIFNLFDFNFTDDPKVIAYMEIGKARIVVNRQIDDEDTISLLVRHEILHEYLDHMLRMERHLGKEVWDKRSKPMHYASNVAGDYEISNRGYTSKDKIIAKHIKLNGEELQGLVTEIDHPEWVNFTLEEIYDELEKEMKNNPPLPPPPGGNGSGDGPTSDEPTVDGPTGNGPTGDKPTGDKPGIGSSNGKQNGQPKKSIVRPGDKGDQKIQELEEINRQANKISDDLKKDKSDDANQLKDELDDIKDDAENLTDEINDNGLNKSLEQRVEEIKELFSNAQERADLFKEVGNIIADDRMKEMSKKQAREIAKYKKNGAIAFELSLNDFLSKELTRGSVTTWTAPSKKYDGSGIFHPGKKHLDSKEIPSFNVYFDQSASWSDEDVTRGDSMMSQLYRYQRQNRIKVNLYYFSNSVCNTASEARSQGGTNGVSVAQHILKTQPDNVIIMTDSDTSYQSIPDAVVPGGVWLLFKDGRRSQAMIDHIHGTKVSRFFDFT